MDRIPITPEGHARLKAELAHLKSVEQPKVSQEIAVAREHGDLRENAEYHAAREKAGFIKGRIDHLEGLMAVAEVIDPSKLTGERVAFGAWVRLSNTETGEEVQYRIVGQDESDTARRFISIASPLARHLIGRVAGDEVTVRSPGGTRTYELLEVTFR